MFDADWSTNFLRTECPPVPHIHADIAVVKLILKYIHVYITLSSDVP